MLAAAKQHAVPSHTLLRPGDQAFWDGIILSRAHDEWTKADLVVAAQLARTQADIEKQQQLLDCEGAVIDNARGTPVMNPRVSVLEGLARREMALMRTLRMGRPLVMRGTRAIPARSRLSHASCVKNWKTIRCWPDHGNQKTQTREQDDSRGEGLRVH